MAHSPHTLFFGCKVDDAKAVDTEGFDDIVDMTNSSNAIQVDTVLHDTEELHDSDFVENSDTEMVDGYDTEVVPDSDDDIVDSRVNRLFVSGRKVQSYAAELGKVKSYCNSPVKSYINIVASADGGHVPGQAAGMFISYSNDVNPNTIKSDIQATVEHVKYGDISEVKDPCLADTIACDCIQLSEKIEGDENGNTSQSKTREVSLVYTRKKYRSCHLEDNRVVVKGMTDNEYGGLSYLESQEPEDISKALLFVDQYVCVNATSIPSSLMASDIRKEKSPPGSSVKGTQSLVRLANFKNRGEETGIFEWDDTKDGDGVSLPPGNKRKLSFKAKKCDQSYVRRTPSSRNTMSKEHGSSGVLWKEKGENFNKNKESKDLTLSGNHLAVYDISAGVTRQVREEGREICDRVQGEQVDELSAFTKSEAGAISHESEAGAISHESEAGAISHESEHLDIGIGTQMAAEAMQALSYTVSADCGEVNAVQSPHKILEKPLGGTHKTGLLSFPKKARSASRGIAGQSKNSSISWSDHLIDISQASKLKSRRSRSKSVAGESMDRKSYKNSGMVKFTKKTKGYVDEEVKVDAFKENLNSLSPVEGKPLCKMRCRQKHMDIYPATANLKSSNLFNMNEGLISEFNDGKFADLKVGPYDKTNNRGKINNMLGLSYQKRTRSKFLCKRTVNRTKELTDKDETYLRANDAAVHISVGKIDQIENDLRDKGKEGGTTSSVMPEVSGLVENHSGVPRNKFSDAVEPKISQENISCVLTKPSSWYLRDYPRGKRTCRVMLDHCEKSAYTSVTVSTEDHNHYPKSQLDSESCVNSTASLLSVTKKPRSSTYISPCSLSTDSYQRNFLRNPSATLRQDSIVCDYDHDAEKNRISSEQLSEGTITVHLDKADRKDSVAIANESPNSCGAAFACSATETFTNRMYSTNLSDGYPEHGKKKSSTTALTRELCRLGFTESMPEFTSRYSRQRKTMSDVRILFSQNMDDSTRKQQKKILLRLGVPIASCPSSATHFVTDKFARTRNMLEIIAQGKPVVTHRWLESCEQAVSYIDERNYILRDVRKEQELGFRLPSSLDRARRHPLLKGYRVFITPNTKPGKELLSNLVKAVHGQAVDVLVACIPKDEMMLDDLLILSCEEDHSCCVPFLKKGRSAYSPELLLNGIVIQKLEFDRHQLFRNHCRRH